MTCGASERSRFDKHEPQIGMGDELVGRIHHIGIAGAPRPDARHHVPDRSDVDFGRRHLGCILVRRHGNRDERLGLVPEVDRADIGLFRFRFDELGRIGVVLTACHRVERQARHAQLLLAGKIQMADLGDRRDVAQQAQEVDLALFGESRGARVSSRLHADPGRAQRGHVDRALHRAAKMLEDLSKIALDLARGRQRLRPLEPDDRLFGLLVREIELDGAAHGQQAAHQYQQKDQILAEQAARHR